MSKHIRFDYTCIEGNREIAFRFVGMHPLIYENQLLSRYRYCLTLTLGKHEWDLYLLSFKGEINND